MIIQQRQQLWRHTVATVTAELNQLDPQRRAWIRNAVSRIGTYQQQMHELFLAADGPALCRRCLGACCACGTHHFTLVNLLAYLVEGDNPPEPDFGQTCPFLGASGCLVPVSQRPFNCVIFLCEEIWANLTKPQQHMARQLEDALRRQYLAFDDLFAGASLRGLLIRAERLGGLELLAPPAARERSV
jgi:hypothetical protein